MKKMVAVTIAAGVVASVVYVTSGATAQAVTDCNGGFPIFDRTAYTEQENEARIACVSGRREGLRDRLADQKQREQSITQRIENLRLRRHDVRQRIAATRDRIEPLSVVIDLLKYVRTYVTWLNATSTCESGNDPDAHSESGTYHGKLQFSLETWRSLETAAMFGVSDPHTAPAIVQDRGGVELLQRSGDEQWPRCGD